MRYMNGHLRWRSTRLLSAVAVLVAAMASGVPSAHADTGDQVLGNYTTGAAPQEICSRQTIDAKATASGTSGTYWYIEYRCDGSGYTGTYFSGTIDCIDAVGSRAVVGGSITTKSANLQNPKGFGLLLNDNTLPSSPTAPDRVGLLISTVGAPTCPQVKESLSFGGSGNLVTSGDIKVVDGQGG